MTKMTSAYANKLLKKLAEDKNFWMQKESEGCTYVAALDEEPLIPDYDYAEVAKKLEEIDEMTVKIKHAINISNCSNKVTVGTEEMTVDQILVKMAQLSNRRCRLDNMRRRQPKTRINSGAYNTKKTAPEFQYTNYDIERVQKDYDAVNEEIQTMQLALDKYNQTVEFEVDI